MKDENIRNKWKQFIDDIKYKQYFKNLDNKINLKSDEKPKKKVKLIKKVESSNSSSESKDDEKPKKKLVKDK